MNDINTYSFLHSYSLNYILYNYINYTKVIVIYFKYAICMSLKLIYVKTYDVLEENLFP